jgi:hypothetical protein
MFYRPIIQDGRLTSDEFVAFLTANPFFFGPLVLIERLFRAYDANGDGMICEEELFVMLLDIEIEQPHHAASLPGPSGPSSSGSSSGEPDVERLQFAARQFVQSFDAKGTGFRDGELSFLDFVHLVHRHPELVGSAAFLRPYFEAADGEDT